MGVFLSTSCDTFKNTLLAPIPEVHNALQNLTTIYKIGFNFVTQLFRIQIQKGGKVLLWNQVKSGMETCYSELVLY